MHGEIADALAVAGDELGELAERDVPIGAMTTYRVGGAAALFVELRAPERLVHDLDRVARAHQRSGLPVLIIGRGSNLLIADEGFSGIALSVAAVTDSIELTAESASVVAGGGVLLPVLARRTAAAGLRGFEWAVGVPGSVGGAVRMNAGGHGSDIAASLVEVTVADLDAHGAVVTKRPADALGLRFRGSELASNTIVLDAMFRLARGHRDAAERQISEIVAWRRANQPGGQNAGSVFVNPVPGEISAGELIDAAGLRGVRLGTAMVSAKHANFIQADDGGRASDVRALMRLVRDRVQEASGFRLRSEIRLVGFDPEHVGSSTVGDALEVH